MCTADRVTSPDPNLPYWRKRISNTDSLPRNRDLHTYRSAPNISQEKKVALATANFATKRSFCEENATAAKGPCCSCILEQCNLTNLQWHTYFASPPHFQREGFIILLLKVFGRTNSLWFPTFFDEKKTQIDNTYFSASPRQDRLSGTRRRRRFLLPFVLWFPFPPPPPFPIHLWGGARQTPPLP